MTANTLTSPSSSGAAVPQVLRFIWHDRRAGAAAAASLSALGGVLVALTLPRGPATAAQALLIMGLGLALGLAAGLALPSRWVALLVPAAHIAALELARVNVSGPTVDLPRLDNLYGLLALVLGRGFHGLVGLLPLSFAAALGAGWARSRLRPAPGGPERSSASSAWLQGLPNAFIALCLVLLAIALAWPGRTPPILGADGRPLSGSIAELVRVPIGGHDLGLMIRGHSVNHPVLLYLSGGPGQSDLAYVRALQSDLEQDFIVVGLDQRGTGLSYAALDPTATYTLDRAVADVIEVTNYLRLRFDEDRIYLAGVSWGTTLGVLAVQSHPELYHAWIGGGQMVSQRETDRLLYADMLALAAETGDTALADRMRAYGEPPYADVPYANAFVMGYYGRLETPYTPPAAYIERGSQVNIGPFGVFASEYSLVDKVNVIRGLIDMFTVMYPQLQHIDFRHDVPRLEIPVYIFDGGAELSSRRDLALEWFEQLEAPRKRLFTFPDGGHSVLMEHFADLHRILLDTILPETYPQPSP
jgi:pimeloyl-ACP methyl ester carboxylesterase